ncbi:hypothetical protein PAMA_001866 [Pampus argenteus]
MIVLLSDNGRLRHLQTSRFSDRRGAILDRETTKQHALLKAFRQQKQAASMAQQLLDKAECNHVVQRAHSSSRERLVFAFLTYSYSEFCLVDYNFINRWQNCVYHSYKQTVREIRCTAITRGGERKEKKRKEKKRKEKKRKEKKRKGWERHEREMKGQDQLQHPQHRIGCHEMSSAEVKFTARAGKQSAAFTHVNNSTVSIPEIVR